MNERGLIQDVLMSFLYLGIVAVVTFMFVSITSVHSLQFIDTAGVERLLAIHGLRSQHTVTTTQLPNKLTFVDVENSPSRQALLSSPCLAVGIQFEIPGCEGISCQYNSDADKGCATRVIGGDCAYSRLRPLAGAKGTLLKTIVATNDKPVSVEAVFDEGVSKSCVKK